MAQSLNKVTLIGNLGKDPEIRSNQAGDKIANITLATSETWTDRNSGEKKERTEWHRVTIFNDALVNGVIEKFVHKGDKIYVEGALRTRKWTDQQGQDHYTTEVVLDRFNGQIILLGGKDEGRTGGSDRYAPASTGAGNDGSGLGSEIPF